MYEISKRTFSGKILYNSNLLGKYARSFCTGVKLGCRCMRKGCWERHLGLGWMRKWRTGRDCSVKSFMICTPHQIIFGWSNHEEWNRWGMWHVWGREGFWWESLDHLQDLGIDGRKIQDRSWRNWSAGCGLHWSGSWQEHVMDTFKHILDTLGSTQCG